MAEQKKNNPVIIPTLPKDIERAAQNGRVVVMDARKLGATLLRADESDDVLILGIGALLAELAAWSGHRYALARAVLTNEKDELARDDRNAVELEKAIARHAESLLTRLAALSEEPRALDGSEPLWLDAMLADYLDQIGGEAAKDVAGKVRATATERASAYHADRSTVAEWLKAWLPDGEADTESKAIRLPALRTLARVIWRDEVKPKLLEAQRKPPALVMAVAEPVADLLSRPRREQERNGQLALRLPGEVLVRVGAIEAGALDALMVDRGVKLFGSLASHHVLRWLVFEAHSQALARNPDPRVIRIDGGWSTFANDVLGMPGKKEADHVRAVVEAMHATELPLPPHGNYSRLLIREAHTPRGRGKQWIKLIVGFALLPDYVHELQTTMGNTVEARRATRLVPLLPVPPLVGRRNEHGAQAAFSMLLVAHIRDAARELVEHGGVAISEWALADMARRAGLPAGLVPAVLDRWTQDGTDAPAFLRRVERDRFTLGDAHANARAFLEAGGKAEINGAAAGRRSGEKRRGKVQRLAGKDRAK